MAVRTGTKESQTLKPRTAQKTCDYSWNVKAPYLATSICPYYGLKHKCNQDGGHEGSHRCKCKVED